MREKFAHSEPQFNSFVRCLRDDSRPDVSHPANMAGTTTFGENLKTAREALAWSQERLANEAGTSKGYISDLERDKRPIPPGAKLAALATALGVPMSSLLRSEGPIGTEGRTVPVVGYVGAGAIAHYYASGQGGFDEVPAPQNATANTVAAEIRGESLGPLLDGWLVFYDEVRNPPTEDMIGRLCVVGLPDDRILVKQLQASRTPGCFHLLSNNEPPIFDAEIVWAARVKTMTPR